MENKNTKQRLDELYDLLKSEYITESEFRSARANILRESGFDLSPAPRRMREHEVTTEERRILQEEPKGRGCGCFLFTLFLIVAIAAGAIFAVPEWPDRLGGRHVRGAREKIVVLWSSFFPAAKTAPIPESVPSRDVAPRVVPDVTPASPVSEDSVTANPVRQVSVPVAEKVPVSPPAVSPDVKPAASQVKPEPSAPVSQEVPTVQPSASGPAAVPPVGINLPSLPDSPPSESSEPDITVVEIPSSVSSASSVTQSASAPEKAVRGFITANSARIRSTPDASIRTNVVGWGRNGDRFTVQEEAMDKDGAKWYRVHYEEGDKEGWISASLVKLEN